MRAAHFRRIEAARDTADASHTRRFRVASAAAAGIIGFLAGSTALAMADALPDPAQQVAHNMFGAVRIDVPAGKEGKRGPCVSQAAKIKDREAKRAAMDACPNGGPDDSGTDDDGIGTGPGGSHGKSAEPHGDGNSNPDGDPCRGRPPWAGPMSKQQREAAKAAASRDACPDEAGDDADDAATPAPGASDQPSTTDAPGGTDTTTVLATTTTIEAPEPSAVSDPTSINPSVSTNEESTTTQAG